MMIFKKAIPRRTFLRGVGTTLALPLLDSMVPAFAAVGDTGVKPNLRLANVYVPNGRIMARWTPITDGSAYELTPTLEPLAQFRNRFLVLSGLNIKAADAWPGEGGGVHGRPAGAYLTGIHPKPQGALGISMDQVAAKKFGKHTQLGSLELGLDSSDYVGGDDGNYSAFYSNTISWRSGTTPLPMEINPRAVFERMFGDSDTADPKERLRRIEKNRSILDSVTQGVNRLLVRGGTSDRIKLTEYLDAIRDVERRIQVTEKASSSPGQTSNLGQPAMGRPAGIPTEYAEHAKLMFDLMVLAYQSDMTRVITFMMGRDSTDRSHREIGVADGHHALSHHKEIPETMEQVAKIDLHQIELFADFLEKMRSTPDGDGSLLDHSIIIYGSSLSNGNYHLHNDVPILLVGGKAGQIKGGRHIRYPGLPLSNLHLAVLDKLEVSAEGYIDSENSDATGKLEGLSV
jgi:hypothetical protein